jgi:hypothetical protein
MLEELSTLLAYIGRPIATKTDFLRAITQDNCLGKRSEKTRRLTYRHLVELYSLDTDSVLFRALIYFWYRDEVGRPLIALLCAYARDPVLRASAPYILETTPGTMIVRESLEEYINNQEPDRFSRATLKSTAQNINSSWTKAGHLSGRVKKVRTRAKPTAGSAAYALLLGYLTGARGQGLLYTDYAWLLDCHATKMIELAEQASRSGWINLKRVGDVIDVHFPNLVHEEAQEWLREQS